MDVPCTYVSKIENEKATPTLSSLARLARALEVSVPDLLRGDALSRQQEIESLMADEFIASIMTFIFKLDAIDQHRFIKVFRALV